jgi:hypothetical protein
MKLEATNWSVTIVGQWNTAIFTPNAVARNIFELPAGDPVTVEVALDAVSPYRIKCSKYPLVFMARRERIEIEASDCKESTLEQSMKLASKSLSWLGNTPVEAAGFNIRYKVELSSEESSSP